MTRRVSVAATGAVALLAFWSAAVSQTESHHKDFHCQWAFARAARDTPALAYEADRLAREPEDATGERTHGCEIRYPPVLALLYAPLALADAPAAARFQGLASLALAVLAAAAVARILRGRLATRHALILLLLFPGTYVNLALGQNALVSLAALSWAWAMLEERRQVAAGLLLSLLCYKPQWLLATAWIPAALGLLRVYAGIASGMGLLVGATLLFPGIACWEAWLPAFLAKASPTGERPEELASAIDVRNVVARLAGEPHGWRLGWVAAALLLGSALALLARRASGDRTARAGLLLAGSLAAPHVQAYDATVVLLPVLLVAATAPRRRAGIVAAAAFYAALPLAWAITPEGAGGPPLATLAALGALAVAWLPARPVEVTMPACSTPRSS